MVKVKRVYEKPARDDGHRILVDRLWPRGLTKEKARVDSWLRDMAPSDNLRKWFGHDPDKWDEFKRRYFEELEAKGEGVKHIRRKAREGDVTLLYGSKEERLNNAVALREYLKKKRVKVK